MANRISVKQLRQIISEELDTIINHDRVEDLEAREDAWSGGDNLVLSLDIADATGGLETVKSPETLSITDDTGVFRMSEASLRKMFRKMILES